MELQPWGDFPLDPRDPANASLRASDADREVIRDVLASAYEDGRLDREEFDERSDQVGAARTLGELPAIVGDLVPQRTTTSALSLTDIQQRATEHWQAQRRAAAFGFLGPTLVCWVVWGATGADAFPWPLIVTVLTLLNLMRTLLTRSDIERDEVRRLEKKRDRQLRQRETGES